MAGPRFYVLEIGLFGQYRYSWYEVTSKAVYTHDGFKCPNCGAATGPMCWQPPYEVVLKQPRNVGDFILGAGGCDLLVSERFLHLYEQEQLGGIEEVLPITVVRMGTTKAAKLLEPPKLYGLYLCRSLTHLKYEEMGIDWGKPPNPDYCRICGPGGGSKGGWWRSRKRVVVDKSSWTGEDIFYAINGPRTILLSGKASQVIIDNKLTNAKVIPCEEAEHNFLRPFTQLSQSISE